MWKEEEVNNLVLLYDSNISLKEMSIKLNKSELSIYKKLKRMNKYNGRNLFWTKDEEVKLISMTKDKLNIIEISKELNRSIDSVRKKMNRLNIKVSTNYKHKESETINWSKLQDEYDSGKTYKDIINEFKITPQKILKAQKEGKIKFRSLKEAYQYSLISGKRKIKTKDIDKNYQDYREMCSFNFNLNDFKEEFDFTLIESFGWYKAKNNGDNPIGVSRDHKVSVKYGFENKIDPSIISHLANCQLIQQTKNSSKGTKNSISIEELIKDIEKWNNKYPNFKNLTQR